MTAFRIPLAAAGLACALGAGVAASVGSLPEPSTWALMIVGVGAAGGAMRRRRGEITYRLVEVGPDGETIEELFPAPDDATAIGRARMVSAGGFELWREDRRIAG